MFPDRFPTKRYEDLFVKFKKEVEIANRILGYDIVDLCVNDPQNLLGQTQYTQPALFVVNALAFFDKRDKGETADYFAGHSLGEYNALLAAGCFDFETGLKLVKKRGELIAEAKDGGMAAIVGLDSDTIINSLKNGGVTTIDLANYNTPSQIVISGPKNDIAKAIEILNKAGAKLCAPLNVSGAFHSRYMKPSADSFALFLKEFKFNDPLKPVISNRNARPYEKGEVIENLSLQINHSVLWTDSIRYLMGKDVSIYEELGNGNVLSGLVTKIQKEAEPIYVVDSVAKKDPEVKKLLAPEDLGSKAFKTDYGIKFAYYAGAMYRGTASKELVVRMAKAGHLAFLGTGGMDLAWMEKDIKFIQEQLAPHQVFGANLLCNLQDPVVEENSVALFIKYKIKCLEASAFMDVTPALVWYRLQGLKEDSNGKIELHNKIIVKLSRPEVAEFFLTPPSPKIVAGLVASGKISKRVGELAEKISMIDDICVEADSGGHTDAGHTAILLPAIIRLRDEACKKFNYSKKIRVGTGGGIGTPEAAAAAFILGADFIVTGSINQCTVEAGTSDVVKDLLNQANVQDTTYAPAGDMFEVGARVQVLKKGLFFCSYSQ
ncbi:MAG: ACP S-malonyltransferase [Bacteriovoracaceae bacterium]